jgi:hypothetical protein
MSSSTPTESTVAAELARYPTANTAERESPVTKDGYYATFSPFPGLCGFCQSIIGPIGHEVHDAGSEHIDLRHHGSISALRNSTKNGCGSVLSFSKKSCPSLIGPWNKIKWIGSTVRTRRYQFGMDPGIQAELRNIGMSESPLTGKFAAL